MRLAINLKRNQRGFTLAELLIVVAILGILAVIAIPQFRQSPDRAREAVLKTDLHTIRESIDQYFADKGRYPDSIEALVEDGYMRAVPVDPFTKSSGTWQLIYADDQGSQDELPDPDAGANVSPGVFDIKSGATHQAQDGTYVSEW